MNHRHQRHQARVLAGASALAALVMLAGSALAARGIFVQRNSRQHWSADGNLVSELIAEVFDRGDCLIHSRTARFTPGREPVAQRRILLNAFFDDAV